MTPSLPASDQVAAPLGTLGRSNAETEIRHHRHLLPATMDRLFAHRPQPMDSAKRDDVASVLGASLYMPAHLAGIADRIGDLASRVGVTSVVVCLEDSVPDAMLASAEENLLAESGLLGRHDAAPVLVFVRPRSPEHLVSIAERLGQRLGNLAGFACPKFSGSTAAAWLDAIDVARQRSERLFAMPILEGGDVLFVETRRDELATIAAEVSRRAHLITAIRIGGTDLSGLLGIRRGRSSSIYEIPPVAAAIGEILNIWCRAGSTHVVTGPVWEYYRDGGENADLGLIHETERDIECGMLGKSVIHPSQVRVVNALLTVTWEDWADASSILESGGGASASVHRDRMNEAKPHLAWALRILRRSRSFGVLRDGVELHDLIAAV